MLRLIVFNGSQLVFQIMYYFSLISGLNYTITNKHIPFISPVFCNQFIGTLLQSAIYLCDFDEHLPSSLTCNIKNYRFVGNYILCLKIANRDFSSGLFHTTESSRLRKPVWSFQSPREMVASCFLISEKSYAKCCLCQLYIIPPNSNMNWKTLSARSIFSLFTSYKFHLQMKHFLMD